MSEQDTSEELEREAAKPVEREAPPKVLGLVRWVQMAFMVLALVLLWVFDKILTIAWARFAEPDPTISTLVSAALAAGVTVYLYRHEKVSRITHEIVGELTKVTWPSREETQVSTVVVIIASIIAAAIVGVFDAAWSWLTDFIYKV